MIVQSFVSLSASLPLTGDLSTEYRQPHFSTIQDKLDELVERRVIALDETRPYTVARENRCITNERRGDV